MGLCLMLVACQSKTPEEIAAERGLLSKPVVPTSEPPARRLDPVMLEAAMADFAASEVGRMPPVREFQAMPAVERRRYGFEDMVIDGKDFDELTDSANAVMAKMPEDARQNFSQIFRFLVISATKSPTMQMKVANDQQVRDEYLFEALYQYVGGKTPDQIVLVAEQVWQIERAKSQLSAGQQRPSNP